MLSTILAFIPVRYLLFVCLVYFSLLTCKGPNEENEILKLVYIEGIHDDPGILTADSLFLSGKLKEAAEYFTQPKRETSRQLYCQARLAEMDYYLRELYGKNHENRALDSIDLPQPINETDSFCRSVHHFYSAEKLDTHEFNKVWEQLGSKLTKEHYLYNKGYAISGEYFYKMDFNEFLLDSNYKEHKVWCKKQRSDIYDCYWTNIRLASGGTYSRSHIESEAFCNELIEGPEWQPILDSTHLALAYTLRGYIIYREDRFEKAFSDNQKAIKFTAGSLAIPVYQEALKSQLTVTNYWLKDTLWFDILSQLKSSIDSSDTDYVNFHRQAGLYEFERGNYLKALPHHKTSIDYCLNTKHLNRPVLNSLCFMYSKELEETGQHREAIEAYRLGDLGFAHTDWNYEDLFDSLELSVRYQFFSLAAYGHIYFTWFLKEGKLDLLEKAEKLALLAHQLYFRDVDTREENALFAFSPQRDRVLGLLSQIYAEKYLRFNQGSALHKYHQYAEENRGAIFWKNAKSTWDYDEGLVSLLIEEQKLNAENLQIRSGDKINQGILEKNISDLKFVHLQIKQEYPAYYHEGLNKKTPAIETIQDTLRNRNASLISFDIIENDIFVLWIRDCDMDLFKVPMNVDRLAKIQKLGEWMSKKNSVSPLEYGVLANDIWNWLIPDRIKDEKNSKWVIVLDDYLHRLNLEALVVSLSKDDQNFNQMDWLIHRKEITYTPLIKSWLLKKEAWMDSTKTAVGFSWSDRGTLSKMNKTKLDELPGSISEIENFALNFPNSKIFMGKDATRKNFINAYTDPDISTIHLAIHGYGSGIKKNDIMLFFRKSGSSIDTFYGYELLPYSSKVKTVILSSCESAKGKIIYGEGNYNLARNFLANGSISVISSLWMLDDKAAAHLFQTNKNSDEILSIQLRKNKIQYLDLVKDSLQHPFYWGSLVNFQ